MVVKLVVAEKPSVARDIVKALTAKKGVVFTQERWGFSSPSWWVAAARGHLLSEANPDVYDPALKEWSLESLPIVPNPVQFVPRDSDSAALLGTLSKLMNDPAVGVVVNACDAGREGELIFKLVYQHANCGKRVERAWFSSMTADTLVAALDNPRPDSDMAGLEAAARCRSKADWLIGMNSTRAATVKLTGGRELLSLGRVQTPTLALVVERDWAIAEFTPSPFWLVKGTFTFTQPGVDPSVLTATHHSRADDGEGWVVSKFTDEKVADAVCVRVRGQGATVTEDAASVETSRAPRLFDLTTLQREANTLFGFSAADTLRLAQLCYEEYKVLTYPRTDSEFLPKDMEAGVVGLLTQLSTHTTAGREVAQVAAGLVADPDISRRVGKVVNDAKVTDHHAIIPTGVELPADVPGDVFNVYTLVLRRTLAAVSAPAVFNKRVVMVEVASGGGSGSVDVFRASGRTMTEEGWMGVYPPKRLGQPATDDTSQSGDSDDGDGVQDGVGLPMRVLKVGQSGVTTGSELVERTTHPPKHFTDATLLAAMSTAGRLVDDEELAAAMKDSGLGTPATRAAMIEKLLAVGYLERSRRNIRATQKGRALIGVLGDHVLTSPEVTGRWELGLKRLERTPAADVPAVVGRFNTAIVELTTSTVEWFRSVDAAGFTTAEVLGDCPVSGCGGNIVSRKSSWSCDSWKSKDEPGCGFVIWKKQSGRTLTRAAALKMLQQSDGTVKQRQPRVELCDCPSEGCGGKVVVGEKAYGCSSWTPPKKRGEPAGGCGFVLWRTRRDGTVLDDQSALRLIGEGVSDRKPEREKLADCPKPKCRGHIVETAKAFSCDSWSPKRKGCGTTLWKTDKQGNIVVTRDNLLEKLARM